MTLYELKSVRCDNIITRAYTYLAGMHKDIALPITVATLNRILYGCEIGYFNIGNSAVEDIHYMNVWLEISDDQLREYLEILAEDVEDGELDDDHTLEKDFDWDSYKAEVEAYFAKIKEEAE